MRQLGHKSIDSTLIYVNIELMISSGVKEEYIVKVAETVEEAIKLIEVGFECVIKIDG